MITIDENFQNFIDLEDKVLEIILFKNIFQNWRKKITLKPN